MAAHQAPLSLGFSRQEHWSGLPFPSPRHESEKWKQSRSVMSDSSWPTDYSLPGSSVHGIFQAGVLDWGAIAFSKISSYNHINSYFPLFLIQNIDAICTVPYLAFFTYLYIQKIVSYQYLETLLTIFVAVCTSLCAQTMVYSPIPLLLNTGCLQTLHVTHNLLPMAFYTHTSL